MQLLQIEAYDRVFVREDGELKEVDFRLTDDDRLIIRRGLDSREIREVQRMIREAAGHVIVPLFDVFWSDRLCDQ